MDQHQSAIALVVAGDRAGFFVREADGSIQAVRSYEEFSISDGPMPSKSAPARRLRWASAAMGVLSLPAVALAYWRPVPIEMRAHAHGGQLFISWDVGALDHGGRLEITDAHGHTVVRLSKGTASATFGAVGSSMDVRLSSESRSGYLHWAKR